MKDQKETNERIHRAIEGLLSPEEQEAFESDVVADGDLRSAYVERVWLHATLRERGWDLERIFAGHPVVDVADHAARWKPVLAGAVAASLLLGAIFVGCGGLSLLTPKVARLIKADNCKWAGSALPTLVNSRMTAGTLILVEGIATLEFKCGAKVCMEAPATLQILDSMHCRLVEGSVTADVPDHAHGFTVDTPEIKVIDWGTKFGVSTGFGGRSHVCVFEGEVEVEGATVQASKRLTKGQTLLVDSGYSSAEQEPVLGRQVLDAEGWTSVSTSFGRGKDGYVRRGNDGGSMGMSPLLMVKHTELPASKGNERRIVLTFDVSQIDVRNVTEAQLVLDPKPTGFGFPSLVPDSKFAVYGINEDALNLWEENTLMWESLPGCTDSGVAPESTARLAEFFIARGAGGGTLTVRGEALSEFLRRRKDGFASFIIVRETGESDPSGLVHGFASKEYPGGTPPTLRVR
jgi:hypothetical protein